MTDEAGSGSESALVILVPEAEPLIGAIRLAHDPSAAVGVPAHITINYPFVPRALNSQDLNKRLRLLFASEAPFAFSLQRVGRFSDVLYLAPEPEAPFRDLIHRVAIAFPESPPYGGAYDDVVPHLTVADSDDASLLARLETQINQMLSFRPPIRSRAASVWLLENPTGLWQNRASFPLGDD